LIKGHPLLQVGDIARDGEPGAACLLPTKQVAGRRSLRWLGAGNRGWVRSGVS
jgi:hypothetical protein